MFTQTITYYSHKKVSGHDTWIKQVIDGCQWTPEKRYSRTSGAVNNDDLLATITIPDNEYLLVSTAGLDYIALGECGELNENNYNQFMGHNTVGVVYSVKDRHFGRRLGHWKIGIK